MHHRETRLSRAVASALAGSCVFVVWAPQALAQQAGRSASALEEVVVTAQRREQALQDVPITLQVVDQKLIDDTAAEDMGDLDSFVPGLEVTSSSPTQPRYTIRGIQTGDFGVGTDPAVGVYVDGVYAARSGASLLAFNDIERIEVLKGPQGTLFGRNSAAGAVSIITRQPQDEFDASVKLRYGEFDKQRAEGMVNVPLGESFALRVNALYNKSDGWLEDAATGKDIYPEDNWAARAALRWELSEATSATLTWDHDDMDQLARPAIGLIPLGPDDVRAPYPADPDTYLDPRDAKIYNDVIGNEESRTLDQATLFVDHAFDWSDFRSTTAWRQFETVNREDEDGTNKAATYFDTANVEDNESFYQEFKFSGASDRFDWVGGVSYYKEDAEQTSDTFTFTDGVDTVLLNLGLSPTPDGTLFGFTSDVLASLGIPATLLGLPWREPIFNEGSYEAYAAFGDVIWHATDRLNLTFGLRYTHDDKEFSWFNGPREAPELDATIAALEQAGFFQVFPIPPQAYQFDLVFDFSAGIDGQQIEGRKVSLDDSWDDFSPRFVVDYAISDDTMVFGSVAKGYKAGGFNSVQPLSLFDNEEVWNYEAGIKNVFPDIGLVLNAAAYYYVYNDKQSIRLVPGPTGISQYVVDTSDEEAFGIDAEATWQVTDAFRLSANVAWIDASYKDYVTPDGEDLSGEPTGQPYFSAALGASYLLSLDDLGGLEFSARYSYRGESRCNATSQQQGDCQTTPVFEVGEEQNRMDLRVDWTSQDEHWGAAAYVTNVFDDQYISINNLTTDTFGTPFAFLTEPRQWGIEVRYEF
jgi:iron complex outermembrane receptor protein